MTIRTTGKPKYQVKTQAEIDEQNESYDNMMADKSESDYLNAMDRADRNYSTEW